MPEYKFKNHLDELKRIGQVIEKFAEEHSIPDEVIFDINLSVDELITNVILYAFKDDAHHDIYLILEAKHNTVRIEIIDDGNKFNPFAREDPDINIALENRRIGGLGIYFVKQKMDYFEYKRDNNKNYIILKKKF